MAAADAELAAGCGGVGGEPRAGPPRCAEAVAGQVQARQGSLGSTMRALVEGWHREAAGAARMHRVEVQAVKNLLNFI